jgi:hypothetical protein
MPHPMPAVELTLVVAALCVALSVSGCRGAGDAKPVAREPWRGVHVLLNSTAEVPLLERAVEETLAPMGVNVLVVEINYNFEFQSHPECRSRSPVTKADARRLAEVCRKSGVRLIPQLNCLGHQSWKEKSGALLLAHPEFEEPSEIPATSPGFYCRSWCPLDPDVNPLVFDLMDELIDAFEADAFHVGMDEVFVIASSKCPRCKGRNRADVFARAVNDYHRHLVEEKKVTMLMWGDRLLDAAVMHYSDWEASRNGTAAAIDRVPKDIIICDWHYGKLESYPSVPYLQEKGFRVWPSSWKDAGAAEAFMKYSREHDTGAVLGQLFTTWVGAGKFCEALLAGGDTRGLEPNAVKAAEALRTCVTQLK